MLEDVDDGAVVESIAAVVPRVHTCAHTCTYTRTHAYTHTRTHGRTWAVWIRSLEKKRRLAVVHA